jgi:ferrous iron transport protein A
MRDNLIRMYRRGSRRDSAMSPLATLSLHQLAIGARGTVARVVSASPEIDAVALRRLGELGFLPGEPVQLLRRGPGGREPLAVVIGETMFALRLLEAQCIEVTLDRVSTPTRAAGRVAIDAAERARNAATAESVEAP